MKISGSYASLLRGVSQQAPEVRQPGQHAEQVNLLSDPIAGLVRRRGTVQQALVASPRADDASWLLEVAAASGYRVHEHISNGHEYVFMFREENAPPTYTSTGPTASAYTPPVICYNRTLRRMVNISATSNPTLDRLGVRGISAITSVGKLVCFALKGVAPAVTKTQVWGLPANTHAVTWIRGGAYSRTYSAKFPDVNYSYTTPDATATGAAAAISPQNIATVMASSLPNPYSIEVKGSHWWSAVKAEATWSDGGDGTLLRGIYAITDSVDKLPIFTRDGHVVKIQTGASTAFYLKASAKVGSGTGQLEEVRWIETAGEVQGQNIQDFFCAVVDEPNNTLYLASNPQTLAANSALVIPQFQPSTSGDSTNNPLPTFLTGRPITFMGMFQDRLVIAAGAAVAVSRASDYFNFFRTSVTSVLQDDAFEMIAQGGEDDTLRHAVLYSRNLVLFGEKRQYAISGNVALTPTSANMSVMTSYAEAASVMPVAAGGQIYYARNREGNVGVHQIQPGSFVDSAESFPASAQINSYIPAACAQLDVVPGAPSQLLVRSRQSNAVYVFSYLDQPDGRKQDAWSRWEFNARCGALLGFFNTPDGVLLFWLRNGSVLTPQRHIVVDLLPMNSDVGDLPYLDSMIPFVDPGLPDDEVIVDTERKVAYRKPSIRFLIGTNYGDYRKLLEQYPTETPNLMEGYAYPAYVVPTNPFLKDGQGLAMLTGRTTITLLTLNMKDSSGVLASVTASGGVKDYRFNARISGANTNLIGRVPVTSGTHSVLIGKEVREYSVKLAALDWLPFSLVGIEWTGQSFNRTPRA